MELERQQVKTAEDALLAALRESEKQATALEKAGQTMDFAAEMAKTGAEYMLRGTSRDGIEIYETSKDVRALPWKERKQLFMSIMQEQYRGRTARFDAGGEVYYAKFDGDDLKKNIYGDKKSDARGRDAKINAGADGDIFDLVEHADYFGPSEERGKKGRAHKGVTGWGYFVKTVQIDGRVYDLVANVRKKLDGEYVYSIQLNENVGLPPAEVAQGGTALEWGTTDNDRIAQLSGDVNGDFSLKGQSWGEGQETTSQDKEARVTKSQPIDPLIADIRSRGVTGKPGTETATEGLKTAEVAQRSEKQKAKQLKNAAGLPIIEVKSTRTIAEPGSITQRVGPKGGIDRNFYGEDGKQMVQISNNGHGHKKEEAMGIHGEHAHDYFWDEDGNLIRGEARELTDEERRDNNDFL